MGWSRGRADRAAPSLLSERLLAGDDATTQEARRRLQPRKEGGAGARSAHVAPPPGLPPIRALKIRAPPFPGPALLPPSLGHSKGSETRRRGLPTPRGVRPSANPVAGSLTGAAPSAGGGAAREAPSGASLCCAPSRPRGVCGTPLCSSPLPVGGREGPALPLCARDGPPSLLREILSFKGPVGFREVELASVQRQRSGWMGGEKSHRVHAQDSSRALFTLRDSR